MPRRPRLRIGLIGGVDRSETLLARAAATVGCEVEHHTGRMAGRRAAALSALIKRVDLLVILTDVNSHSAVLAARRLALSCNRRHVLMRRCSPSRLIELITSLSAGAAAPAR